MSSPRESWRRSPPLCGVSTVRADFDRRRFFPAGVIPLFLLLSGSVFFPARGEAFTVSLGDDIEHLFGTAPLATLGAGAVLASAAFLTEDQAGYAGFMGHGFLEDGARICDGAFGLPLLGGAGLLWAGGALADADGPEETGRMLTEGLLMTYGATAFLKLAFSRTRPDGDDQGFPSAHSAGTACVAVILWDRYGPSAGIPAAAVAGFTALSRVTLGKHYPSDVIAGAAIGISFGLAVAEAYRDDGSGTGLPSLSLRWDTENGLGVGF